MHLNDEIMKKVGALSVEGMFEVRNRKGFRVRLNGRECWTKENKIRESARCEFWRLVHDTSEYKAIGYTKENFERIANEIVEELFSSGELTTHQIK